MRNANFVAYFDTLAGFFATATVFETTLDFSISEGPSECLFMIPILPSEVPLP